METLRDELLERRDALAAFGSEAFEPVPHPASADVLAFRRGSDGDAALVVINVRDRAVETDVPGLGAVTLAPYEWRIEEAE